MKPYVTISDLARTADVPISTVRYYERVGLIEPDRRSESNYRLFSPEAVKRLRFIRSAQSTGLTISDIKALLELKDGKVARCGEVRVLLEQRSTLVKKQIKELHDASKILSSLLDICNQSATDDGECKAIDELEI